MIDHYQSFCQTRMYFCVSVCVVPLSMYVDHWWSFCRLSTGVSQISTLPTLKSTPSVHTYVEHILYMSKAGQMQHI